MAFELLAPLMFAGLAVFLLAGYPVAFALAANGMLFAFIGFELGLLQPELLQAIPQRLFGIMANQLLLAIPFFTFMGLILERSGLAEDLLDTIGQLFGRVRGGVAYAVIFVGALLAATTGVIAASVIAMGLISLPVMLRYGYSRRLATGVICASGTLAQIIPPSIVLIVLADVLGASVGDLYAGALLPSALLVGLLVLYVAIASAFNPAVAPALPEEARTRRGRVLYGHALFVMVPPLVLIFLVLGSIFMGVATPTEGGAMGAVGALALALARRRLDFRVLREALDSTVKLSSFVMFILIGSTVFALVFRAVNGDLWVERLFDLVPGGVIGFLIAVNLIVFVLGFFIDFFEIAFILLPLIGPVAAKLGIDPVWFAVIIGMNLQTSFLTPPFGFALFYLRSVAPKEVATGDVYRGILPFVAVQVLALVLVMAFPGLTSALTQQAVKTDPSKVDIMIDAPAPPSEEESAEPGSIDSSTIPQPEPPGVEDIERALKSGR
ncbi:MAG: C4-dicarboxylate ABC transporter [Betaproteobacteria bacterium RIFCSPLOWO2_02_FULL_65_24]|nr:MAG: C4-dicarboxylate ABC transporter [Betaproteobacteria bacterium RIFCSPLOWO2_02_FULL_65_24]